jgi:hypothetical protein
MHALTTHVRLRGAKHTDATRRIVEDGEAEALLFVGVEQELLLENGVLGGGGLLGCYCGPSEVLLRSYCGITIVLLCLTLVLLWSYSLVPY